MKKKIIPDDNNLKSLHELTSEANKIIEELEKEDNLKNSLDSYHKLVNLNNTIQKKFQEKSKTISKNIKEKISHIIKKKNEKKA